jgi:hypothetical protein
MLSRGTAFNRYCATSRRNGFLKPYTDHYLLDFFIISCQKGTDILNNLMIVRYDQRIGSHIDNGTSPWRQHGLHRRKRFSGVSGLNRYDDGLSPANRGRNRSRDKQKKE